MNHIRGDYFLINGSPELSKNFDSKCKDLQFNVYEVIRIIGGIPLFGEEHFRRMENSLQLLQKQTTVSFQEFDSQLKLLAEKNNFSDGNVKVSLGVQAKNVVMFFIPHYYPTEKEYKNGVKTGFYNAERTNPNAKTYMVQLRANVNSYLTETKYFEVFYTDRNGFVTEGSRSNVFFIREGKVYTCTSEKVLLGVTRQKTIECLKNLNIPLIETMIPKEGTASFESVFLTGTSPKILPVASIDNQQYSCNNNTMRQIMKEYDRMISKYLQTKQA